MDARLKQRLIGAFVLLAIIVIVVPMFFSGHEQGGGSTTSVSLGLPAQPQPPLQSKTFELGAPAPPASAGQPPVPPGGATSARGQFATVTVPGAPAQPESATLPQPAPDMPVASVTPGASGAAAGAGAPSATPPVPATQPATQAAAPKPTTPAATRPEANAPLPVGTAAQTGFIVSLGAYADEANARALAARVRKLGVKVGEQPMRIHGKPVLRVYAGPYANRALAEDARLKIRAAEPHTAAVLVADNTSLATDQPAAALPAGKPGGWVVQLGAFDTQVAANGVRDRARGAGFPAYVDTVRTGSGVLWRVRVGPEARRDAAMALKAQIKARLNQDGIVAVAH